MRKTITKVTACSIILALAITAVPAKTVKAALVLPAAGIAATTGVGSNLRDIQASIARAKAKEASAKVHTRVSVSSEIAMSSSDAGNDQSEQPLIYTQDNIEKVETPASKALNTEKEEMASGAKAATIEVTDSRELNDDGAVKVTTNSSKIISEQKISEAPQEEKTTVTVSAEAATPEIEVKPESADVGEGEEDLTSTVIAQVDGYVNVRETPDENGEVVGKLYNHSAGEWLGKEGDWYKISSGNVVGYVKGEYVVTGQAAVKLAEEVGVRTATVHTETLRIRQDANADSAILGLVPDGDELTVVEETDEWVKVSIEEGDGWVSKEFVSLHTDFPKAESKAEEEARIRKEKAERDKANAAAQKASKKNSTSSKSSGGGATYSVGGSGMGSAVANYGLQFVGNPYVYGGTSLTNGTDCSGFTMGVYRNFGVSLPHSSGAQRSVGYGVGSLAEAQPGDILCYSGHVAIYIGGGQIVHASTKSTGIKVSSATYRPILAIRRIF
ncbi:MAG: SH3 domain-containing C40 family peptidase [Lachnospiraceae bacterium]|nr:SH3 domain-containing C40 family peptidase [Lachnospiraceae bacterium]